MQITIDDDPYIFACVVDDDAAAHLRAGDPDARDLALTAVRILLDALIAAHRTARHDLN